MAERSDVFIEWPFSQTERSHRTHTRTFRVMMLEAKIKFISFIGDKIISRIFHLHAGAECYCWRKLDRKMDEMEGFLSLMDNPSQIYLDTKLSSMYESPWYPCTISKTYLHTRLESFARASKQYGCSELKSSLCWLPLRSYFRRSASNLEIPWFYPGCNWFPLKILLASCV